MLTRLRATSQPHRVGLLLDLAIAAAPPALFCLTLYLGWAEIGLKGLIAALVALATYAGLVLGIFTQLSRSESDEENLSDAAQLITLSRRSML